ncbi:MAG: hypothetical protein ACLPQS_03605 [Acidimicrobiales bacterium]
MSGSAVNAKTRVSTALSFSLSDAIETGCALLVVTLFGELRGGESSHGPRMRGP